MDRDLLRRALQQVGLAEAAGGPLAPAQLARELGVSVPVAAATLRRIEAYGLAILGAPEHGAVPTLVRAGRQYLAVGGCVAPDVLRFLPTVLDDLVARAALLRAGSILVDGFRSAVLDQRAEEHARQLVPPAFAPAVDHRIAIDLFAASVALLARLSAGQPAGCVGEELLAVELITIADRQLAAAVEDDELTPEAAHEASATLRCVFDLFGEDTVLDLYAMAEPADAAVAHHDAALAHDVGVVDQRVEAWFRPFGTVVGTGHYHAREPAAD